VSCNKILCETEEIATDNVINGIVVGSNLSMVFFSGIHFLLTTCLCQLTQSWDIKSII